MKTHKISSILINVLLLLIFSSITCSSWSADNEQEDSKEKVVSVWEKRAIKDLKKIQKYLLNNAANAMDKDFINKNAWLNIGYEQALKLVSGIDSQAAYYYALKFYQNGFHDAHIKYVNKRLQLPAKWPGFSIEYSDGKFLVIDKYYDKKDKSLPPLGARLLFCDGMSADKLMRENVLRYYGNSKLSADWWRFAPYLLLDYGNPWAKPINKCEFELNGHVIEKTLTWRQLTPSRLANLIKQYTSGRKFSVVNFGHYNLWLSIPSFKPNNRREIADLNRIINVAKNARGRDIVVFDLRGNQGGDAIWSDKIIVNLYGIDFFKWVADRNDHAYNQWRISRGNVNYLRGPYIRRIVRIKGYSSQEYKNMVVFNKEILLALREGEKTFIVKPSKKQNKAPLQLPLNPVRGQIYLLTDGYCTGACLNFVGEMLKFPYVMQIGRTTNADTIYNALRKIKMPSGGELFFPMKATMDRSRPNNQPFRPRYVYQGNIENTKDIMQWIPKIYKKHKKPKKQWLY